MGWKTKDQRICIVYEDADVLVGNVDWTKKDANVEEFNLTPMWCTCNPLRCLVSRSPPVPEKVVP